MTRLFLVGKGALLSRSIDYCLKNRIKIDHVLSKTDLPILEKLEAVRVPFSITNSVNQQLDSLFKNKSDKVIVILLNCDSIISDYLLETCNIFYNIHNGLVEKYRGIAEICIFAAICQGEKEYGATLQRLRSKDKVDGSPIIAQRKFQISSNLGFYEILFKSMDNCLKLFEDNILNLLKGETFEQEVTLTGLWYGIKDIDNLIHMANKKNLKNAVNFGPAKYFLPKLFKTVSRNRVIHELNLIKD